MHFYDVAKALGHKDRFAILLDVMRWEQGDWCPFQALLVNGRKQAMLSYHLKILVDACLVATTSRGTRVYIYARPETLAWFRYELDAIIGGKSGACPTDAPPPFRANSCTLLHHGPALNV